MVQGEADISKYMSQKKIVESYVETAVGGWQLRETSWEMTAVSGQLQLAYCLFPSGGLLYGTPLSHLFM